jgi:SAM-dependent methyltransferase
MMSRKTDLENSWQRNADNWTRAVRDRLIPSRKAGTDAAIVDAIVRRGPSRFLDMGCGEGWLCRAVTERTGCTAVGLDGTATLIEAAKAADSDGCYRTLSYDDVIAGAPIPNAPFDVIAFNYALFEEEVIPLLTAAKSLLVENGVIVIQTLHPDNDPGDGKDGWREEDFTAFENEAWAKMPWYFRTTASWDAAIAKAGLSLVRTEEPTADAHSPPLSLVMICRWESS